MLNFLIAVWSHISVAIGGAKKMFLVFGIFFLAAIAFWLGHPKYRDWKEQRFVRHAQTYLKKGDHASAAICLRQALSLNSFNMQACRLMAHLGEIQNSPTAVMWRERVLKLQPHAFSNRSDLIRSALRFRDFGLADRSLRESAPGDVATSLYHHLVGAVSLATNNPALAETAFAEAVRRDPTNQLYQLNLAVLRLSSRDKDRAQQGRSMLEKLVEVPSLRAQALRSLTADSQRGNDIAKAKRLSGQLINDPTSNINDYLQHLDLRVNSPVELGVAIELIKPKAALEPLAIAALSHWLSAHQRAEEAALWIKTLPENIQTDFVVTLALADACSAARRWSDVVGVLADKPWPAKDYLRLAMLSRAFRELDRKSEAEATWAQALAASGEKKEALASLMTAAASWRWNKEVEELRSIQVATYPHEYSSLASLYRDHAKKQDTAAMFAVLKQMVAANGSDLAAKNDLAAISMLLMTQLDKAYELAREVYQANPSNPVFASTYAYSLHLQKRSAEALKVFESLPSREFEQPSIAFYYGVILKATGDPRANKYIALGEKGALLPEERALVAQSIRSQ